MSAVGGGQTWINPPVDLCPPYTWSCLDPAVRDGKGSKEAFRRELARIETKARRGDVRAMRMIGLARLNGIGVPRDQPAGLGWIYEAAIRGDQVSMRVLGRAFEEGNGVAPDSKLAAYWLNRAADVERAAAQK